MVTIITVSVYSLSAKFHYFLEHVIYNIINKLEAFFTRQCLSCRSNELRDSLSKYSIFRQLRNSFNLFSPKTVHNVTTRVSLVHLLTIYFLGITLTSFDPNIFNACEQSVPNVSNFLQQQVMVLEGQLNDNLQYLSRLSIVRFMPL